MKKKFTIIYTVFASAVMLFALLFLGYNLNKEYKQGASRTASVFANTVFDLYQELDSTDETQRNFSRKVSSAVGDFQDYSFYELQKNGNVVFSYPANSSKEQTKSNFTKEFSTQLEINDNNKYMLTCNIYLLRPSSIYHFSKISFFIILAITVITFLMIIMTGKKSKKSDNTDDLDLSFDDDEEKEDLCIDNNDSDIQETADLEKELEDDIKENVVAVNLEEDIIENISKQQGEQEENEKEEQEPAEKEDDFSDISLEDYDDKMEDIFGDSDQEIVSEDNKQLENTEPEENSNNNDNQEKLPESESEPEGLFSHTTGLGWESYLLTRLNNELERSVASEMDISLFVIQLTDLPRDSENMKNICEYIVEQFQFRDLIFEYKEDCIVAIKNSTTLEDALTFAEKIYTEIMKMLEGSDSKCYIGISTRTVRIISGERFLKEAEEALYHAKEDKECSIIAFRADVEKYRKYLETKLDA